MKENRSQCIRPSPPIFALAAFLLTLGVLATTPLAWAKYAGSAQVTASASVAKFEPEWTWGSGAYDASAKGGGLVNPSSSTEKTWTWNLSNRSEVLIEGKLEMMVTDEASGALDHDRSAEPLYPVGDYTSVGGRVNISDVASAGTLDSIVPDSTAEAQVPIDGTQDFVASFTGAGAPDAPSIFYGTDKTTAGVATPVSHTNSLTAGWRAYRVNFDGTAVQVD